MAEEKKNTTTFGLSSRTVARLLKLGSEGPEAQIGLDDDQLKAEMLHDRLAETLSLCDMSAAPTSRMQTRMSGTIGALAGESIGALLLAPRTDIDILRRIKDHGRRLSEAAKSKPEHHAANTIYYAAIASALQAHRVKITSFSNKELLSTFSKLTKESWMPRDLVGLFERASGVCDELMKE